MQRSLPRAGRRGRPRLTIIVMVLLSITVLTLGARDVPVLGSVRSGLARALAPVENALRSATRPFRNAWGGITDYEDLQKKNEELRRELDALKSRDMTNQDALAEVNSLKAQLGIPFLETSNLQSVVAQVAPGNYSTFDDNTVQIDKGSEAGIKVGMTVVSDAGVVGRVTRTVEGKTTVQLLTDSDLRIGIRLTRDGRSWFGVGRGTGYGRPFLVDTGISLDVPVAEGDPVMTSGQERAIMPPGLPIGRVTSIDRNQSDQTQLLQVRLEADIGRLNYVRVLLWEPAS